VRPAAARTIAPAGVLAAVVAAGLTLGSCGATFVDETVATVDTSPEATTTTLPPVPDDAPLDDVLTQLESLVIDLDQVIIDDVDESVAVLARIDELWQVAERQIRANDPDDVFNFEQAIELARTGVERRRPADASKGHKILVAVNDAYLDRT
jgi:hypothetical protein